MIIMLKRTIASLTFLPLVLLTGCATQSGSEGEATAGSNRPSATAAASAAPASSPEPEPSPSPAEDAPLAFGKTFTYENDVSVTISPAQPYKPSEYSAVAGAAAHIIFDVTVVNGGTAKYDPTLFYVTLQSANVEAEQAFDSEKGLMGSPNTSVLPGRETKFKIGFGVTDPKDLVMEASPGFEYNAAIWAT